MPPSPINSSLLEQETEEDYILSALPLGSGDEMSRNIPYQQKSTRGMIDGSQYGGKTMVSDDKTMSVVKQSDKRTTVWKRKLSHRMRQCPHLSEGETGQDD